MPTKTTIVVPKHSLVDSTESSEKGVSSRRLKKREIDRRCQRQARERTKSRIAYLEGLVDDFRRQDATGQVTTLMKQLQEVEVERDMMARTLKDIQKAMDITKPLGQNEEQSSSIHIEGDGERKSSITSLTDDAPMNLKIEPVEEIPRVHGFDMANFTSPPPSQLKPQDMLFAPEIVRLDSDSPLSTSQVLVQCKTTREENPMPSRWANNWAKPNSSCACHSHSKHVPGQPVLWRGNYWVYANEVLSERFNWGEDVEPATDALSDDVPIRALLEGWDAVAKRGPLHPSWQILRRIDETLFPTCPNTERLAVLRAMHSLLQFHTESTSERYQRLPAWYMRRPSQSIAHSYAIDYFAWPGIRERFIFSEHNYCENEFWHLFCRSLRILWPYEFRDCYTREVGTGLYKVSPMFDQRLSDIKCWTMGPDIFQRYPELYSDMPAFNHIPQTVSDKTSQQKRLLPRSTSAKAYKPQNSVQKEQEEVTKRPTAESQYIPTQHNNMLIQQSHSQGYFQSGQTAHQTISNPHLYNLADYNPLMALDAFAYGAITEADFTSVYQPNMQDGYPSVTF